MNTIKILPYYYYYVLRRLDDFCMARQTGRPKSQLSEFIFITEYGTYGTT